MAHLGGQVYDTIKDAVKYSSGDWGVIATYKNKEGEYFYFVNGRPIMKIEAPKKEG